MRVVWVLDVVVGLHPPPPFVKVSEPRVEEERMDVFRNFTGVL